MYKRDQYIQYHYVWNNMMQVNNSTIVRRDGSLCTPTAISQLIKIKLSTPLKAALQLLILTASQRFGINYNMHCALLFSRRLLTKQTVPSKAFLLFLWSPRLAPLSVFHWFLKELRTYINSCLQTKSLIFICQLSSLVYNTFSVGNVLASALRALRGLQKSCGCDRSSTRGWVEQFITRWSKGDPWIIESLAHC